MQFFARRGTPSTIIGDNGTKFVGVEHEFDECVVAWNNEGIAENLIQQRIRWKSNPTAALH